MKILLSSLPESVTLEGQQVCLEPLTQHHLEEIKTAAADGELSQLFFTGVPSAEKTQDWLNLALSAQDEGKALPFAVRHKISGKIIGSTRYCNIEMPHKRLEIGYTWYAQSYQRSAVNTECKLLLLTHAFEILACNVVEFRTDWFNHKSRAAIARLGAKQDGVLRNHTIMPDGRVRDTVVFSILKNEWDGVKTHLNYLLNKPR